MRTVFCSHADLEAWTELCNDLGKPFDCLYRIAGGLIGLERSRHSTSLFTPLLSSAKRRLCLIADAIPDRLDGL
jgi:hypothetical protein